MSKVKPAGSKSRVAAAAMGQLAVGPGFGGWDEGPVKCSVWNMPSLRGLLDTQTKVLTSGWYVGPESAWGWGWHCKSGRQQHTHGIWSQDMLDLKVRASVCSIWRCLVLVDWTTTPQDLYWVEAAQTAASRCLNSALLALGVSLIDSERMDHNHQDNGVIWQRYWLQTWDNAKYLKNQ